MARQTVPHPSFIFKHNNKIIADNFYIIVAIFIDIFENITEKVTKIKSNIKCSNSTFEKSMTSQKSVKSENFNLMMMPSSWSLLK